MAGTRLARTRAWKYEKGLHALVRVQVCATDPDSFDTKEGFADTPQGHVAFCHSKLEGLFADDGFHRNAIRGASG